MGDKTWFKIECLLGCGVQLLNGKVNALQMHFRGKFHNSTTDLQEATLAQIGL